MVLGAIATYAETVYSILDSFGIIRGKIPVIGTMPVTAMVFPCLPLVFIIAAFSVMVARKYRSRR
jgi:hypothetical protein